MESTRRIILLLGPTAGGKSEVAIELARRLPGGGEIVSADSMLVYRGMNVGTAKPTPAQQATVPHHLIDLIDVSQDGFSVDTWLELADRRRRARRGRGRWPRRPTCTNLYVQALLEGLFEGPAPDEALRGRLAALEPAELRRQLERVDPEAARMIHPNDRKRTIRAIEVFELAGKPISELQTQWGNFRGQQRRDVFIVGLEYPPEVINRRINARVGAMMRNGLLDEARLVRASGGMQAREALGYKQLIDHFEGRLTLEDAVEQIKVRTRRYAKQQRTWLRRFRRFECSVWIEAAELDVEHIAAQAMDAILASAPRRV